MDTDHVLSLPFKHDVTAKRLPGEHVPGFFCGAHAFILTQLIPTVIHMLLLRSLARFGPRCAKEDYEMKGSEIWVSPRTQFS